MTILSAAETPSIIQSYISQTIQYSSSEVQKVLALHPEIIIGTTGLFYYDEPSSSVCTTPSFCELLAFLAERELVDPAVTDTDSITELNNLLQQEQGPKGGFLRKKNTERWELNDELISGETTQTLDVFFEQLGFTAAETIKTPSSVDYCIVFGAHVERMCFRLQQTIQELQKGLTVNDAIFLLGANRKLWQDEIDWINTAIKNLEIDQQEEWTGLFSNAEFATEANAFSFLWATQVPKEIQSLYRDRVISINSTRIGASYREIHGHRVTTEVTIDDMMEKMDTDGEKSIFAISELPYIRLTDQLRYKLLKGTGDLKGLAARVDKLAFYFVHPAPSEKPLKTVILDEVARNVYHTLQVIKYIETQNKPTKL